MKRLLSLYDYTGNISQPFYNRGWDVLPIDLQHGYDIMDVDGMEYCLDNFGDVDGIIAQPPCTDFTISGAQYWAQKDADSRTAASLALVEMVINIYDVYRPTCEEWYDEAEECGLGFFWILENPVGRLPKLVEFLQRKSYQVMYVQPWEYAGHLDLSDSDHNELDRIRRKDAKGVTQEEAAFVIECNAYTKKTGLWGSFNRNLEKKPIEPVRCCKQGSPLMMLGGKSERTKNLRSATPLGLAEAIYLANCEHVPPFRNYEMDYYTPGLSPVEDKPEFITD